MLIRTHTYYIMSKFCIWHVMVVFLILPNFSSMIIYISIYFPAHAMISYFLEANYKIVHFVIYLFLIDTNSDSITAVNS